MTVQNAVFRLAGFLVLLGLILGLTVSNWFFIIVGFVGLNMFQTSFTGFCPAEKIFSKMGVGDGKKR